MSPKYEVMPSRDRCVAAMIFVAWSQPMQEMLSSTSINTRARFADSEPTANGC